MRFLPVITLSTSLLLMSACGGDGGSEPATPTPSPIPVVSSSSSSVVASSTASSSSVANSQSSASAQSAASSQPGILPATLANKIFSRTIERISTTQPSGTFKDTGILLEHYGDNGTLLGDNLSVNGATVFGSYSATYDIAAKTIQVKTQLQGPNALEVMDTYTFVTATEGTWMQDYGKGSVLLEGTFSLDTKEYPGYAPAGFTGRKAALTFLKTVTSLPAGTYINSGTAFHLYQSATRFTTDVASLGIPNAEGTYTYERPALNMARDAGFNVTFNAPYQIDYEFKTLTSGNFKENWNNGQILWEGTFEMTNISPDTPL